MQWIHAKKMEELSSFDLYQILKLRQDVFIIEQESIYEDIDNIDPYCEHILLKNQSDLVAYSRIVPANKKFSDPSIGRIIVQKKYRGKGYGSLIVQKSLDILLAQSPEAIIIEAQSHLQSFYESLGFYKVSKPYPVDGIPHIKMNYRFDK